MIVETKDLFGIAFGGPKSTFKAQKVRLKKKVLVW
jgi:hypothetical protein